LSETETRASSVEEDEQVHRAMVALGFQEPRERAPGERVEDELDSTIERRARQAAKHNGQISGAEAQSRLIKFNAKQREARRQRELCLQRYDYHCSLQEVFERLADEQGEIARSYLREGTTKGA
jgi:hypothetical protein